MVETLPPLLAAGVRFGTAGAIFLLVLRLRGGPGKVRVTRAELLGAALIGNLLCFGGNGLVTVAERDVPSGLAALIIGSVPLWVVVMRSLHGERVPRGTLAGVLLGFAGLAVLVLPGDLPGVKPESFSADSLLAFGYLIVFGSLIAFTTYVWLLRNAPISTVATYAYVNPLIAIFLGWAILEEEITATVVAGAAAIVLSVAAVVRRESAPARVDEVAYAAPVRRL